MRLNAIIDATDHRWEEALRRVGRYDFYHLPAYVALEAERREGTALAYVYSDDEGTFLAPFLESLVPLVLAPSGVSLRDALPPYGYAGPLVSFAGDETRRGAFMARALAQMMENLRLRGIGAIVMRFHPLLPVPLQPFRELGTLVLHGETVWADLRQPLDKLWSDTRHGFRYPIRRMEKAGFQFELDQECRWMTESVKLYHDTMNRVHADPQYYFSGAYFMGLKQALGTAFLLAHVRNPQGLIVSSGAFTACCGIVQYHLSGNSLGKDGSDASKLLLHGVRTWAKEQGLEQFHLGGGVGARNDSLFLFKSGFAAERAFFYTWRHIIDESVYAHLSQCWEKIHKMPADGLDGYFPAYRKMPPPIIDVVEPLAEKS